MKKIVVIAFALFLFGASVIVYGQATSGPTRTTRWGGGAFGTAATGPDGTALLPSFSFTDDTNTGTYSKGADDLGFSIGGTLRFSIDTSNLLSTLPLEISSDTGYIAIGATRDTYLYREAAQTWAQRNGTNQQILRVYGTYTDASNYERVSIKMDYVAGNRPGIIYEAAGTGAARAFYIGNDTANVVNFRTNAADRWRIDTNGHWVGSLDNTYDIGYLGASRPRTGYFGTSIITPKLIADTYNFGADAQADDDYEVAIPEITALTTGLMVTFTANTLNTGAATLEITSVGLLDAILKLHDQALITGDIEAGQVVVVVFDGTNWQMISQLAQ